MSRYRRCGRSTKTEVVYLGSFSKTFAPGFRVGWVLAPHAVREKLVLAQESATLCPPAFSQYAVTAYLANHDWRGQIKVFREMYRERRDAMLAGLAERYAGRDQLDRAGRRVLRLGNAARWTGLAGYAAAGGNGAGRVRARHRLLCRRLRQPAHATVVLLPTPERIREALAGSVRCCSTRPECWRPSAPPSLTTAARSCDR